MRKALQATAVALLAFASSPALATPRTDCQPQAIRDLQRLSPQGHAIYAAMTDKKQFLFFLTCDNVQLGLATAVHESVHMLTEQKDAYPLIAGGSVKRVHAGLALLLRRGRSQGNSIRATSTSKPTFAAAPHPRRTTSCIFWMS